MNAPNTITEEISGYSWSHDDFEGTLEEFLKTVKNITHVFNTTIKEKYTNIRLDWREAPGSYYSNDDNSEKYLYLVGTRFKTKRELANDLEREEKYRQAELVQLEALKKKYEK